MTIKGGRYMYDLAYGPSDPHFRMPKVSAVRPHVEPAKPSKEAEVEFLDQICSCGRAVVKVAKTNVLEGKMAYCEECVPQKPKKDRPKHVRSSRPATEPQWIFIASLIGKASNKDILTDQEWEYVDRMQTNQDLKVHEASMLITFLKRKLGIK